MLVSLSAAAGREATPSNCGDAHPTLEHQAARRKAPVAGVMTQGMVTASRGEFSTCHSKTKWVIRSQVLQLFFLHEREFKDAVHRLHGGGFLFF